MAVMIKQIYFHLPLTHKWLAIRVFNTVLYSVWLQYEPSLVYTAATKSVVSFRR